MNLFTKVAGHVNPYINGWAQAIHELGTNLDHTISGGHTAPRSLVDDFTNQYNQSKNELVKLVENHASKLPSHHAIDVKRKLKNYLALADHVSSPHSGYTKTLHGALTDSMNSLLDTVHNSGH